MTSICHDGQEQCVFAAFPEGDPRRVSMMQVSEGIVFAHFPWRQNFALWGYFSRHLWLGPRNMLI